VDAPVRRPCRLATAVWWTATAPLTVVGVACAFVELGAGAALALTGFASAVTAFWAWQLREPATAAPPATSIAATGLLGGVWMLGLMGFVGVFGVVGLGICALLAASGGGLLLWTMRPRSTATREEDRRRSEPSGMPALELLAEVQLPSPSAVAGLSTAEVCWAWRLSYLRVRRPGCPGYQMDHLVELRRACLDELEHRDPVAFRQWLPTARAAADPARAFSRQSEKP
jgi:hypothetical protein